MGDADCSPLGLLLLGVREQKESTPYTNIVDVRSILNDITECNLNILRGNNYIIRVPYRWIPAFSGDNQNTKPCPMITGEGDLVRINAVFYPDMVLALTHEAKIAFDNLYFALRHKMIKINITPGKLVYIDNRVALHSRDRFTAQYDANGAAYRWIQRLFIMPNLWPMQNFSKVGPRVFDPGNSAYPNLAINNQILYNDALNDFDSNCSQNIQ
ncbi:MAG: hypothetical protein LW807_00355 [Proteobacteria bacterium]|jgi:hypothetical protein|nr:hypothetical protein [Pseudomonadota bacterium]